MPESSNLLSINRCVTCDQAIPTLLIGGTDSRREWQCNKCGTSYVASLADPASVASRDRLRLVSFFPLDDYPIANSADPPAGVELRRHRRRNLSMKVLATPVNDELYPVGQNLEILSKDLSEGGIGLVHPTPLEGKFAALISFPNAVNAQLILQIVRCQRIGAMYEMGAKFLQRLAP